MIAGLRELLGLKGGGEDLSPVGRALVALARTEHDRSKTYGPRHIYAGTVPEAEVQRRRERNRRARAARRVNRRSR